MERFSTTFTITACVNTKRRVIRHGNGRDTSWHLKTMMIIGALKAAFQNRLSWCCRSFGANGSLAVETHLELPYYTNNSKRNKSRRREVVPVLYKMEPSHQELLNATLTGVMKYRSALETRSLECDQWVWVRSTLTKCDADWDSFASSCQEVLAIAATKPTQHMDQILGMVWLSYLVTKLAQEPAMVLHTRSEPRKDWR